MPVIEQIEDITDIPCQCCGFMTVYSSGFVVMEDDGLEEEYEYVARWTDGKGDHGVSLLVYQEQKEKYANVVFTFEDQSFTVLNPEDNDWGEIEEHEILKRDEVVDTDLAEPLYRALDEIWLSDKSIGKFAELVMLSMEQVEDED